MTDLLVSFQQYIKDTQLLQAGQTVLLAVSGGADSVAMVHLFHAAGYPFAIAHCNFQLREAESDRDEQFVQHLAANLGVPFHLSRFNTHDYTKDNKVSIQVAARELRYAWLEETREANGYTAIATAHHLQDSVETALMNFCKGTGIAGLHGILPRQGRLIRPLLFAGKEALTAYLTALGQPFVEDSSNITDKYTRNYFRHHIIPLMQEAYPNALQNMASTTHRMQEAEVLYRQAVTQQLKKLLEQEGNSWKVPVRKLQQSEPLATLTWELFRPFGCTPAQVPQVLALLDSETGRYVETPTHRIIRNRAWLLVAPLQQEENPVIFMEEGQTEQVFPGGRLTVQRLSRGELGTIPTDPAIACVDARHVRFPLVLRPWKQGDYFYPLGMAKKKKVSRFLIDLKLSLADKGAVWVLTGSDEKMLWIAGKRIDHRFRITDSTTEILLIKIV